MSRDKEIEEFIDIHEDLLRTLGTTLKKFESYKDLILEKREWYKDHGIDIHCIDYAQRIIITSEHVIKQLEPLIKSINDKHT